MPYKDPEKKIDAMREWRTNSSSAYHKWLYERRKLRFDKAKAFEEALDNIACGRSEEAGYAASVLKEMERREKKLGKFFDHVNDVGVNTRTKTIRKFDRG